jgi:hypothetical protein
MMKKTAKSSKPILLTKSPTRAKIQSNHAKEEK